MPRLTRRRNRRSPRWTENHLFQLATQYFDFGGGWGRLSAKPDDELREAIAEMAACWEMYESQVRQICDENQWLQEPWFAQYADETGPQRLYEESIADPARKYLLGWRPEAKSCRD